MMQPTEKLRTQLAIRLSDEDARRIDRIAEVLTERAAGAKITRSSAYRQALLRGIPALEAELGITQPKGKAKRK